MSIDGWMDKWNMVYTYNGILFTFEKEGSSDFCYSMEEPWDYYVKQNKPVTKRQKLYDTTYNEVLE